MHDTLSARGSVGYEQLGEVEREEVKKQVEMYIEGVVPEIEVRVVGGRSLSLSLSLSLSHSLPPSPTLFPLSSFLPLYMYFLSDDSMNTISDCQCTTSERSAVTIQGKSTVSRSTTYMYKYTLHYPHCTLY